MRWIGAALLALACATDLAEPADHSLVTESPGVKRSRFFDRRGAVNRPRASVPIPDHPPEAGRLLYLLEGVGIGSADSGTTVQSWTDPTTSRPYSAAVAGVRPSLIAPGYPRGDGGDRLTSTVTTSQVLSASEYFFAAVINPIAISQFGAGADNAIVFADASGWWWLEVRQTAAASGLYEAVVGHWNAAASPSRQRQIRIPIVLGQDQLVWGRFKSGVVTGGVNSLAAYDNVSATVIENVATNTGLFGSSSSATRFYNGNTRVVVSYGAHSDSDKNLAIQSLAQRFGITLTSPDLEEMVAFVVLDQSNGEAQGTTIDPRATDPRVELFGYDGLWHHSAVEPLQGFKQHILYRDFTPSAGVSEQLTRTGYLLAMADRLRALGETRRIGVLNCSRSATNSNDWVASLTDLGATTALAPIAQLRLDAALARGNIKIGAVIIGQGEGDSVDSGLANGGWATNWTAIADRFASRYSAHFDHATLRFILHRLFPTPFTGSTFHSQLRATQAAWADARSDTIRLDKPDPPNAGDTHLETVQLVTLGVATADAWFAE